MKTNEQYAKEANAMFERLFADNSPVRNLSEARRENSADPYKEEDTRSMFDQGLEHAITRFGEIVDAFGAPGSRKS